MLRLGLFERCKVTVFIPNITTSFAKKTGERAIKLFHLLCIYSVYDRPECLLILLWCLTDEVHELVELRSDDNLCATVLVLTGSAVVVSNGVVLATSCCGEALWIYAKLCLESLNYT